MTAAIYSWFASIDWWDVPAAVLTLLILFKLLDKTEKDKWWG